MEDWEIGGGGTSPATSRSRRRRSGRWAEQSGVEGEKGLPEPTPWAGLAGPVPVRRVGVTGCLCGACEPGFGPVRA
jgi:hypothetical protein